MKHKIKQYKKISRNVFKDVPTKTKVYRDKTVYSRKVKHKKLDYY